MLERKSTPAFDHDGLMSRSTWVSWIKKSDLMSLFSSERPRQDVADRSFERSRIAKAKKVRERPEELGYSSFVLTRSTVGQQ